MALAQLLHDVEALSYPEYRARHLFTAKLRLVIFLCFWFLYVSAFKDELASVAPVTATIAISFIFTVFAYYLIIARGKVILAMGVEAIADVVAISAVVYLTGGMTSDFFTLYVLYSISAGGFYNYRVALIAAIASAIAYIAMFISLWAGWLPTLVISSYEGHHGTLEQAHPWVHPLLLLLLLGGAVYVTYVAHGFTQRRERMLEEKNRELAALHRMSNSIRSASPLPEVADRVLNSMLSGLDFSLCLLMLLDKKTNRLVCYPPRNHPMTRKAEALLGFSLSELYIPLERLNSTDIVKFHRSLYQLSEGIEPALTPEQADAIQGKLGLQVMVTLPLIVENDVIGTCIGMTTAPLIEDHLLSTLEVFANQSALLIQTTMLIEELKTKNTALTEANRVKSEFLATMSHELRTPLTAIIGFSELLLEGVMGELNNEQRDSLREVLNNGTSLLDLINNLLDFVKVESGKMGLNYQRFTLPDLIDRLRRGLWPLIQRKELNWEIHAPDNLPPLNADEKRMQQVLLNLVSNAIKFTPDKGTISVHVNRVPHFSQLSQVAQQHLESKKDSNDAFFVISVRDTGIGISPENLERIFEMFKQIDSSISRSYEGTGLGLALAKQLVELHGGTIWAESELGHGATFICILPSSGN
ncbi:MAG: hypothetical protein COV45_08525 [Deltaproteobacteria bacterium CG11_big_fil_rev_8_21_14_0_20_47_16]|nr:MAG: hypothetical protein COV45_08525 [Deltaproteobacteria bacterium CG11_big_fil_rev_8_21_14_0_20_47_16]